MSASEITDLAMELSVEERLALARRLVESVVTAPELEQAVNEGIRQLDDFAKGNVKGLTEREFWAGLE